MILLQNLQSTSIIRAEGIAYEEANIASPGIGSTANSFLDFVNVEEWHPSQSVGQHLHRSKDPGVGAFTYFHSRYATASKDIAAGQELFVDYGNKWFLRRAQELGPIPVKGDHQKAEELVRRYQQKFFDNRNENEAHPKLESILRDMWETFVLDSSFKNESRVLAALPQPEDFETMLSKGLVPMKEERMRLSNQVLQENGVCVDDLYLTDSSIPQAGHGVFARRHISRNKVILPVPLIHIPDRKAMDMYEMEVGSKSRNKRDPNRPRPPQLLLNYCLGHRDSTILLSPYGPVFNLINHNQTLANAKLQWASPSRSQHDPTMLQQRVSSLHKINSARLAMELVATRDIEPNEEILLDYGDEWESAWLKHVKEWQPVKDADDYVAAIDFDSQTEVIRTEFEQMKNPYPANTMLKFYLAFQVQDMWRKWLNATNSHERLTEFAKDNFADGLSEVEVLKKWKNEEDIWLYRVVVPTGFDRKNFQVIDEVPRESLIFQDRPYSTDMFLPNVFRHDIRIPDELFPDAWRNANSTSGCNSSNGPPRMKSSCGEASFFGTLAEIVSSLNRSSVA